MLKTSEAFDAGDGPAIDFVGSDVPDISTSAQVIVGTDWLLRYGAGINSYSFRTSIHAIGHALGLGHAGTHNVFGSWSADILAIQTLYGLPATVIAAGAVIEIGDFTMI